MKDPLLSICIPTYNRAEYLKTTLESIVTQKRFLETDDVEIVISDNCSEDNTGEIVHIFIETFGRKIRYFRNEVNNLDYNLELSLRRGNGAFLKLNNDTLKYLPGSLDEIIQTIENNRDAKRILFFLNQGAEGGTCKDLDSFVEIVSFHSTWIGGFGLWKDDLQTLTDYSRYAKLQLTQTDVLLRIGKNREFYVNNKELFISMETQKKGGYDIITVFLDNYTAILRESVTNGSLSPKVYERETERLLYLFFAPRLARIKVYPENFYFAADKKFSRIIRFYRKKPHVIALFFLKYWVGITYFNLKKLLIKN